MRPILSTFKAISGKMEGANEVEIERKDQKMSLIQLNPTNDGQDESSERRVRSLSSERFWREFASITDESDAKIDWEESERVLDSFRPDRKLFSERNDDRSDRHP
jgi:hypothetical protein